MANVVYGDITPRTAAYAEKELLKRGLPYLVFEKFGQSKSLPSNATKVIKFRRFNALSNTPVTLTEGVTPAGQSVATTDITATLDQYGGLVTISDVIMDTHEDDVLNESVTLLGEQAAQMIEKMRFGVLKSCTNVVYSNGTVPADVNTAFSVEMQRRAVRALKRQNARPITTIVRSTPSYGTEAVSPGFVGIIHPDLETDIRKATGFVPAEKYGSITPWENEVGKIDDVRYISTTIAEPWVDAGGNKGLMLSTGGVNADVYPIIYLGRDAYGIIALKGAFAITPMVVNPKPSDSDPLAQRGSVSWKGYQTCILLNDLWMALGKVAATA